MNINAVIDYLNKTYGYDLDGSYYSNVADWRAWWKGFYKPFHEYEEGDYAGKKIRRKMFTLKMAKKISEDWASILLNEKTIIKTDDKKSMDYLFGDGSNGVLERNNFSLMANELIEKAWATGTGAFVLRLVGMKLVGDVVKKDPETDIRIEYLKAQNIVPLSAVNGEIKEVAFVSEILKKGKKYTYIETHILEDGGYVIKNAYFKEEEGTLKQVPLPDGILESFSTGSNIPLFSIFKPNILNNVNESTPLGMSVFANAIDNLEGVDLAYNNFNRDSKLGGKKVFVNEDLTKADEYGNIYTPDDVAQQLFVSVGDASIVEGKNTLIHEHNPELRVDENVKAIQAQLDYLSFKCGLGSKFYRFEGSSGTVTATQYVGEKQDLTQNANKHYKSINSAIKTLIRAILWAAKEVCGADVDPDTNISIEFDDSYISDKATERAADMQEVRDGIMQKWEYRSKWYGEDEETAKSMIDDSSSAGGLF